MFKENCKIPKEESRSIIYKGMRSTKGVQIIVDKIWRYSLQQTETLIIQLRDNKNAVMLAKQYTAADVDEIDKIITVTFEPEETQTLPVGVAYIVGVVNGYVAIKPQKITIKEVVQNER